MSNINNNTTNLENILNDINNIPVVEQATPTISVSSSGLITANVSQDKGYSEGGQKSATQQLSTQAAKTITPSTSNQTAISAGTYAIGNVTVSAIPSSYVKPTATKTAATITPSTSNQTIAAGTYCSGAQTIKGDANLVATNIVSGKSIFGVAGSYTEAPVLLWTNAVTNARFHSEVLTWSGSYAGYIIETKPGTQDVGPYIKNYVYVGGDSTQYAGTNRPRSITGISATGLTIGEASSQETTDTIPTHVWGVKFTL